jgi:hypothetical protein
LKLSLGSKLRSPIMSNPISSILIYFLAVVGFLDVFLAVVFLAVVFLATVFLGVATFKDGVLGGEGLRLGAGFDTTDLSFFDLTA